MAGSGDSYKRIYAVVSRIPRGRVATYGQVARLAGLPGQARLVGYALSAVGVHSGIPWHRVVNAQGRISLRRGGSPGGTVQRLRLQREGVRFAFGDEIAKRRVGQSTPSRPIPVTVQGVARRRTFSLAIGFTPTTGPPVVTTS